MLHLSEESGGGVYIDAFNQGAQSTKEEFLERLAASMIPATDQYLAPVTLKQLYERMMMNLIGIYEHGTGT